MSEEQHEALRDLLHRAGKHLNEKEENPPSLPPPTHNQEDIGDRFSQLTEKLCEYRIEVARQMVTTAENNLRQVEAEVAELRANMKGKWEEYQALMRMLEDAGSATMDIGRKLHIRMNGSK
jgi:hypothetical protein